jgi:uncharacterized OB-fold protein
VPNDALAELLPEVNDLTAPYWEGLEQGEFRLQHCEDCDAYQYPPEKFCRFCPSERLEFRTVEGHGAVYSFITVRQRYHPAFTDLIPYNVSIIELDEGPRVIANLLEVDHEAVEIGMRVRPRIEAVGERFGLYFAPEG